MIQQEMEWAVDMVNDVFSEGGRDALITIPLARQALIDNGITDQRQIANILKRSLYAQDERLNLINTLELF